jgi:hypothetical protein
MRKTWKVLQQLGADVLILIPFVFLSHFGLWLYTFQPPAFSVNKVLKLNFKIYIYIFCYFTLKENVCDSFVVSLLKKCTYWLLCICITEFIFSIKFIGKKLGSYVLFTNFPSYTHRRKQRHVNDVWGLVWSCQFYTHTHTHNWPTNNERTEYTRTFNKSTSIYNYVYC